MKKQESWIWGLHSVEAALEQCPELCAELILEPFKGRPDLAHQKISQLAKDAGLRVSLASPPRSLSEHRTQGVACRIRNFPSFSLSDLEPSDMTGVWALLDRVQDPRNFGAILRSAAAFGLRGVFIGDKEQSPLTGVVAQSSAGNLFRVPIFECGNLNKAVELFTESHAQILGLHMEGTSMDKLSLDSTRPVLWILGSEGTGLREGLVKRCTLMAKIPMAPSVESLNVSAAASIAFYATHKISLDR